MIALMLRGATRPDATVLRRRLRPLCGAALAVSGLCADCLAGLWVLGGMELHGLLLHVPAVLAWVAGVYLLGEQPLSRIRPFVQAHLPGSFAPPDNDPSRGVQAPALDGWTTIALVLALVPFPAAGPLGLSIARGTVWLLRLVPDPRPAPRLLDAHSPAAPLDLHVVPLRALEVQPIVDILHAATPALKRAAIQALSREPRYENVQLLRGLLGNPDPEVRNAAALALFRLEEGFERALLKAETPEGRARAAELAEMYVRYARSGLLDDISSATYLGKACVALEQAIAAQPARADLQFQLAYLQSDLGSAAAARETLGQAIDGQPASAHGYLQGMEIAFRDRHWERLAALTEHASRAVGVDPAHAALVTWWATCLCEAAEGAA